MRRQLAGAYLDGVASTVATDHNPDTFLGQSPMCGCVGQVDGHSLGLVVMSVLVSKHL